MILTEDTYDVPSGHIATVITKLAMTVPAMTRRLPFPSGVVARKETLGLAQFRDLFRAIGTPWLWSTNPLGRWNFRRG